MNRYLKRRNELDLVKTGGFLYFRDQSTRVSAYWVGGERRIGGMNLSQAVVWNSGKCPVYVKRATQEANLEGLSINETGLGGLSHTSVEVPVTGTEQRAQLIRCHSHPQPISGKTVGNGTKPYNYTLEEVRAAFLLVKANKGAAGIDRQSIQQFEDNLERNLYKIYNRLASGSYFPPPVMAVQIPKSSGGTRILGIPTVGDRVAQTVIKLRLEPQLEPLFHSDSYGYRPKKSAHQALKVTQTRCWKYGYVVEFDIAKFFDCLDHQRVMEALRFHNVEKSILLYVERWLTAPLQTGEGVLEPRTKGVPQGGVISPLLANLFLHYVFDMWMKRLFPRNPFCRYADDAIIHCQNFGEAERVLAALKSRLEDFGLTIHPDKTNIVCCQVNRRRVAGVEIQFTFLGYTFRPRSSINPRTGQWFTGFLPAISLAAERSIRKRMRLMPFVRMTDFSLQDVARYSQPFLVGWMNYYCCFYKTRFSRVASYFNALLVRWAMRKFKKFRGRWLKAVTWLNKIAKQRPALFPHWNYKWTNMAG